MARLKIRKIGDSLGIVLPKNVLSRLQVKEGSELLLNELTDGSYSLSPFDPGSGDKMAKAQDIMNRFRNTLQELAK